MKTNLLLVAAVLLLNQTFAQVWTQKANVPPGNRYYAFGTYCNGKAYIGTGVVASLMSDFWEFDPMFNTWTQKASMPIQTCETATFTVGGKVYVSGGMGNNVGLFEYDPATDLWTQKANSPGISFWGVGFSIGNKGYVHGGSSSGFYEYDPALDLWTTRAPLPTSYAYGFAFTIGNKGYVGKGGVSGFYEYDPSTDMWTAKQNFPGLGSSGIGFALHGKGYAGLGTNPLFYEYDAAADTWTLVPVNLQAGTRSYPVGFASADYGYFGTGQGYQDFWEFTPPFTTSVNAPAERNSLSIAPNPSSGNINLYFGTKDSEFDELNITDVLGEKIYSQNIQNQNSLSLNLGAPNGIYFVRLKNNDQTITRKILISK